MEESIKEFRSTMKRKKILQALTIVWMLYGACTCGMFIVFIMMLKGV